MSATASLQALNQKINQLIQSKKALNDRLKKATTATAKYQINQSLISVNKQINTYRAKAKALAVGANLVKKELTPKDKDKDKDKNSPKNILEHFMRMYLTRNTQRTVAKFSVSTPKVTWGLLRIWFKFTCDVKLKLTGYINTVGASLKGTALPTIEVGVYGRIGFKIWSIDVSVQVTLVGILNAKTNYSSNLKLKARQLVGTLAFNPIMVDTIWTAHLEMPVWVAILTNKRKKKGRISRKFSKSLGSAQICKVTLPNLSVVLNPREGKFVKSTVSSKVKIEAGRDIKAIASRIEDIFK